MVDALIYLHDASTTDFTAYGLGVLSEAVRCTVKEELNGMFEAELEYPINGTLYSSLKLDNWIYVKPNPYSKHQPFYIYKIERSIKNTVKVFARHWTYQLAGWVVKPYSAKSAQEAFTKGVAHMPYNKGFPFKFVTDVNKSDFMIVNKPTNWRKLLGGNDNSIVEKFGGEYEFDNNTIYLRKNRGVDRGVTIDYGRNLTDIKQETNISTMFTHVYPYWIASTHRKGVISEGEYFHNYTDTFGLYVTWEVSQTADSVKLKQICYLRYYNIEIQDKVAVSTINNIRKEFKVSGFKNYTTGIKKKKLFEHTETVNLTADGQITAIPLSVSIDMNIDYDNEHYTTMTASKTVKIQNDKDIDPLEGVKYVELPEKIMSIVDKAYNTRIYNLDLSSDFEGAPTAEQLRARAKEYIKREHLGVPDISISVSFIDLADTTAFENVAALQSILMGDTVSVHFELLGVNATAKCIGTEYNAITDRYDSIQLGETKASLSSTISNNNHNIGNLPSKNDVNKSVAENGQLITGGFGGYVLLHSSTGGSKPDEILILDTDNIFTAKNVWRWNANGFGHSSTGYNGEYDLAITADGRIIADFIKGGILDGSLILANSIQSEAISQEFKQQIANNINNESIDIRQAFTAADGELVSRIERDKKELTDNLGSVESSISELKQTIEDLTFSFSNQYIGGSNLILNSSGLDDVSDDWIATGYVVASQYGDIISNTTSGSAFIIENGTLTQFVHIRVGSTYTITFKAKATGSGLSTVKINYGNYDIPVMETYEPNGWSEYSMTFKAVGSEFELIAETVTKAFYVADFMLVEGSMKSNWTPAPNEIFAEDVKISRRGIHIINRNSSTSTIIDHRQFAVKSGEKTVLTVNKDKTILNKTEIQNDLTVGKLRMVPATDGLDFVLLD